MRDLTGDDPVRPASAGLIPATHRAEPQLGPSKPAAVALLFTLESIARATIATVIPLQAYGILQSARDVSLLYTIVGVAALGGSFLIPVLIRRLGRRAVYRAGALCLIAAAGLFLADGVWGVATAMLIRILGIACLNIALALYIMDYVPRRDLTRSEPLRLTMSAGAWTICPSLGVLLYNQVGPGAALGLSAAAAALLLATFQLLRLADAAPAGGVPAAAKRPQPNPVRSIRRFAAQPRLRLAWMIAFGRSAWWSVFFVYAPLYMVEAGQSELVGALLISGGNAMLFLGFLAGRLARRVGLRPVITGAFVGCGAVTLAAALSTSAGWAALWLLLGSLCCAALDAVGNVPFLRAVRPHERPAMATVFRTYIDLSDLLPPALFTVLLSFFGLPVVFVASALLMLGVAGLALFLPRRM